jgi:hypothetical protein
MWEYEAGSGTFRSLPHPLHILYVSSASPTSLKLKNVLKKLFAGAAIQDLAGSEYITARVWLSFTFTASLTAHLTPSYSCNIVSRAGQYVVRLDSMFSLPGFGFLIGDSFQMSLR